MPNPAPPAQAQRIIRLAMLMGILMFGAVIYFLHSTRALGEPSMDGESSPLALVAMGLVLVAAFSVFVFRRLIEQADDPARRFVLTLVALALCEASALAGGVLWMLSGSYLPYAAGVGVFVMALAWLPGPTE